MEADYFDPALGTKIASRLPEELPRGRYGNLPDLEALAALLTSDMYAVAKDKHLMLKPTVTPEPKEAPKAAPSEETREAPGKRENFGPQKLEILPGNLGYPTINLNV